MKKQLLLAALFFGSALTANAQEPIFEEHFEGDPEEIFDSGWLFTIMEGTEENYGLFNASESTSAIGISGQSLGATTFDIVNQAPVHIDNTDIIITSPVINLPTGVTNLSYKTGSLGIGAGASTHYSVYILTQEDMEGIETDEQLQAMLDTKFPEDSATISGEAVTTAFTTTEYGGGLIVVAFRLHDSPSNSAFLIDDVVVSEGSLGTGELSSDLFAVYPNPAQNFITINGNNSVAFESITISDMNGRTVATKQMNGANSGHVDISGLSSGMYVMQISSDQGSATKKIIKQ